MAASRLRTSVLVAVLGAVLFLAAGVAIAQSKGVPDAPPVEQVLARYQGFEIPPGFRTSDGRRLPEGVYDIMLIESADRYYIQLTNIATRKGLRVGVEAVAGLLEEVTGTDEASAEIRSVQGRDTFQFTLGEFTVATQLRKGS